MASRALKPANAETVEDVLDAMDRRTVNHPNLSSAMAAAFAEIEKATKSAENPAFKAGGKVSKYADLTSIIEAIKPPLIRHGLFFTQRCHPADTGVSVETVLHHSSGEKESLGVLYVPANKQDPQGFGSALTYARRYALQTSFGVPVEDDDGNAASRQQPLREAATSSGIITAAQRDELQGLAEKASIPLEQVCAAYKIHALSELPSNLFDRAKASLLRAAQKEPA